MTEYYTKKVGFSSQTIFEQKLREQAGLSTREMAARMGMTHGGYSKNERGINFPGLDTLQRLSRDFDISMDWLIFNKGPMHYHRLILNFQEYKQQEKEKEEIPGTSLPEAVELK
ncbi:MAG: helix-turn-helix transcriptional regulator [Candidatus Aminicenantes bacterium]|nr:MAG: helix-turn-helix transcriptional regulator [Candidatus Aminicenantes bacterium]